jgi:ubiquinone/menaquinone biosynthesis C-methylase UbiE
MQRVDSPEILDTNECPPDEVEKSLRDLCRINHWFGGVSTTRKLVERVVEKTGQRHFSMLEVAAGLGEVPRAAATQLANEGVELDITDLDRVSTHLQRDHRTLVGDALALPFQDGTFDLVSCSLFAHHLKPEELSKFAAEALRVSRCAVLINDLVRHPLHLGLVYAGFLLMRSYVSRVDGVASVRRAYVPAEIREILLKAQGPSNKIEISRHFLFRMGVILWK